MPGPRKTSDEVKAARRTLRRDRTAYAVPVRPRTIKKHRLETEKRISRLVGQLQDSVERLLYLTLPAREIAVIEREIDRGTMTLGVICECESAHFEQHIQVGVGKPGESWDASRILARVIGRPDV